MYYLIEMSYMFNGIKMFIDVAWQEQAITQTNVDFLMIPLADTQFPEILFKINEFSLT